ncbi:methyltransferase-like protein 27 [Nelusetta ayraudi]|uniref:methyltransferase-like protein 27 n=1 Tax=Nelusetta ayraudi TaxID=303726 RepID=UPI003F726308
MWSRLGQLLVQPKDEIAPDQKCDVINIRKREHGEECEKETTRNQETLSHHGPLQETQPHYGPGPRGKDALPAAANTPAHLSSGRVQDVEAFCYRAPHLTTDFLHEHFTGDRAEAQVLDVGCGSGLVAKLMFEQGFRDFVGVDGSEGMLLEAEKTGLYRKLELAILGPETLPAATGVFDVVIVAGALDEGFIPVSVVKELHRAAKAGGLLCLGRGEHSVPASDGYKKNLEAEFQRMEEAGLWSLLALKQAHRYMEDAHQEHSEHGDQQGELYISGTVYLYRKTES